MSVFFRRLDFIFPSEQDSLSKAFQSILQEFLFQFQRLSEVPGGFSNPRGQNQCFSFLQKPSRAEVGKSRIIPLVIMSIHYNQRDNFNRSRRNFRHVGEGSIVSIIPSFLIPRCKCRPFGLCASCHCFLHLQSCSAIHPITLFLLCVSVVSSH